MTPLNPTASLSPLVGRRTSGAVTTDLFDRDLLGMRRARARRRGAETFLHDRAMEDIFDRLSFVQRKFERVLLIGTIEPEWREKLQRQVQAVDVVGLDSLLNVEPGSYDLCMAVGELETANDLPQALLAIRFALRDDSLFIGAFPGGDTLPALRAAMRAADEQMGAASAHVHPRIEPAAFTGLLTSAGFSMPVVDVDRVAVRYKSLADLVRDLRGMGATNVLKARSRRPLTRAAAAAAAGRFLTGPEDGRVTELFEILHFAAWTPAQTPNG
jgi:NADH dehydrogenase [ubiquinone] 1 alpha subcomplex assembly factor 5